MKISKLMKYVLAGLLLSVAMVSQTMAEGDVLFQMDDRDYRARDLPQSVQQALYDAELKFYKERAGLIDEALLELELAKRAKESGKSEDEVAEMLFAADQPSEDEVKAFYEENKSRINQPFDAIKAQITQYLMQEGQGKKQRAVLDEIKQNTIVTLGFKKPVAPLAEINTAGFPEKGAADAGAVLVEFADYQCPHCKMAGTVLKKVAEQFKDDLKIIYMDFPVNRSGISRKVAEGAACAAKQEQFWAFHDKAYAKQADLKADSVMAFAEELKLDMTAFKECLESDYPAQHVAQSKAEGERLGVDATPTLFLNGRRLHLHDIEGELAGEIEKVLGQ